ncbi:RNA-guided endonuclease InsQ/TnpB family protein [Tolypothrix sp. VBCCA 56010]|uniref:RNA-guided endonuclease InsQ/TnpB family protein n=1 Tax=Tolypothrix sp. VBCCA 56010 TaxID=3137731 RepID=UPI003D7E3263
MSNRLPIVFVRRMLYNFTMLLGFKTELKINKVQRLILAKHAGVARHAWNQGLALCQQVLAHNHANPNDKIKFPSSIDLHKWLVASIKPENPWYYEVSKCSPQYALRYLSDAFKSFFKKVKGFPKFKKKGRNDSFTLDGSIHVDHKRIKVPVIGWLKTFESLPQGVEPTAVTISCQADRWFISFKVDVSPTQTPKAYDIVGVDLGIKGLATLSTGVVFDGAKSYRQAEHRLKRLQRNLSRKVKGSVNWYKAALLLKKAYRRVANIRKDVLHKVTTYLSKNHAVIGIEDLNVSGMMANRCLAKAIGDIGFYEFRRQLEYKCQLYGGRLVVIDRFAPSSKTCSCCGNVKDSLSLRERTYHCHSCGFEIDRDLNAAINISKYAASSVVSACGRGAADSLG